MRIKSLYPHTETNLLDIVNSGNSKRNAASAFSDRFWSIHQALLQLLSKKVLKQETIKIKNNLKELEIYLKRITKKTKKNYSN